MAYLHEEHDIEGGDELVKPDVRTFLCVFICACWLENIQQLAAFIHFLDYVAASNQIASDIQLGEARPVRVDLHRANSIRAARRSAWNRAKVAQCSGVILRVSFKGTTICQSF